MLDYGIYTCTRQCTSILLFLSISFFHLRIYAYENWTWNNVNNCLQKIFLFSYLAYSYQKYNVKLYTYQTSGLDAQISSSGDPRTYLYTYVGIHRDMQIKVLVYKW